MKQHRSLIERFNRKKLSDLEVRKQYQIKISNRFAALEILNDTEDINWDSDNTQEKIRTSSKGSRGLYELK